MDPSFARTALALATLCVATASASEPPPLLLDKGACPFECCTYGEWTTTEVVPAFASPSGKALAIGAIPAKTRVTAITGQVLASGRKFLVHRAHLQYRPGDVLTVYTYQGEGHFKVWFAGSLRTEYLGFSPGGGSGGSRCTDREYCWGELEAELDSTWWAQVKLPDGHAVWVHDTDRFDGADACG